MVDSEERVPVLAAMQEGTGLSLRKTKDVFITVALFAHGYASIVANNHLESGGIESFRAGSNGRATDADPGEPDRKAPGGALLPGAVL